MLVKNWGPYSNDAPAFPAVRRSGDAYELSLFTARASLDSVGVLTGPDGLPTAAYRTPPGSECILSRMFFAEGGHWAGVQSVPDGSTYVYQPDGSDPAAAVIVPFHEPTGRQLGVDDVFVGQVLYAGVLHVYDRAAGRTFVAPGDNYLRQLTTRAAFFLQTDTVEADVDGWAWDRASTTFRRLLEVPEEVRDLRADDTTLVWLEGPPFDEERGGWPPGAIWTSPITTEPKDVVPTRRWSNLTAGLQSAAAIGAGFYAVANNAARTIHILRLADGRRFVIPMPNDEFRSGVEDLPSIDERYLFVRVATQIFRLRTDDLGEGLPPE